MQTQRFTSLWILLGAVLIPLIYVPTLATPFDFIDDGNLVYPAPAMSTAERLQVVADKIAANYEHLGPFRPTLWVHWEIEAELFDANPRLWRAARLAWCMLACGMMLRLLAHLNIRPAAALATAFVTMANPYRNEIWTSLTLAEGVAMPYALLALIASLRAGRSPHPLRWDLLGMICVVMALGCKNTFLVLIPAQFLIRILNTDGPWREGLRRHGPRACFVALTILLPLAHMIYFKLHWHEGQYKTVPPTLTFFGKYLGSLQGAMSLDFLASGLVLSALALRFQMTKPNRVLTATALTLLLGGIALYQPIGALAGRYTMPAVWGLDLFLAAMLNELFAIPPSWLKRAAIMALVGGLVAIGVASIGKQAKFAARAELLWQVVHEVESHAPKETVIGWVCSKELNIEEGIHLEWHLNNRGRTDVKVLLLDDAGAPQSRVEIAGRPMPPTLLVTAGPTLPATFSPQQWAPTPRVQSFWNGRRSYQLMVWTPVQPAQSDSVR